MIIRPARKEDLSGILAIYNDAIANSTAVYEYEAFDTAYINDWWENKKAAGHDVLVADVHGFVAGFATFGSFRQRAAYKTTVEHSVYVHPDHRGVGYGKTLLTAIENTIRSRGYHLMIGGIDAENKTSIQLHQAAGFREAGRIHQAAWKFGRWLDLVFMEKILV